MNVGQYLENEYEYPMLFKVYDKKINTLFEKYAENDDAYTEIMESIMDSFCDYELDRVTVYSVTGCENYKSKIVFKICEEII